LEKNELGHLITIEDFDNFKEVGSFRPKDISNQIIDTVRTLDEREELEPFFRLILFDTSDTPHGPAEIADILTHRASVKKQKGLAAFILKGKSFPTVRPKHVAHQIYRIEKIADLRFAVFAATGTILDQAKEQFCSTAKRLGCQYAIFDTVDLARLFLAHGFLCPRDGQRISAGRCSCGYSPRKRILNIMQKEALNSLKEAHGLDQRAGLVVLPPGSGKTRIGCQDAKEFGARHLLYIAHTYEILEVAESELRAVFGNDEVIWHYDASTLNQLSRINIATIQLLNRNLDIVAPGAFDYLVVDEFHHAAAPSYRRLIERVMPNFLLGLTATPFRGDRQNIFELCGGNLIVNFELRSGIEMGILSPYHYYGFFDDIDYSSIRHNGLRYDIRDLEKALTIPERDEAIIKKWTELAEGKATLAFCCSHRHAYRTSQCFNNGGIPSAVYLSTTAYSERQRLIRQLRAGDIKILFVVDIMNEGIDIPFLECLLFLRPTESKRIFYQQLGRGLRRYIGKSHVTVIDFIGNFKNAFQIVEYQVYFQFSRKLFQASAIYTMRKRY